MSLHDELLEQAERLAREGDDPPRQVDLRRAISSAYYTLFHRLAWDFAALYVTDPALASKIVRTINHQDIKRTSDVFAGSRKIPKVLEPLLPAEGDPLWEDLKAVAVTFPTLQTARHSADYDLARLFERHEVLNLVQSAREAFEAWGKIRDTDWARIYLACFQHWNAWNDTRV